MACILIVDDDTVFLQALGRVLQQAGHQILTADNGDLGCQLFRQHNVALVFVDIFMPEKDGIETILEIKAESPAAKIIAISGGGLGQKPSEWLEVAQTLGAVKTMHKPIDCEALLETIEQIMQ